MSERKPIDEVSESATLASIWDPLAGALGAFELDLAEVHSLLTSMDPFAEVRRALEAERTEVRSLLAAINPCVDALRAFGSRPAESSSPLTGMDALAESLRTLESEQATVQSLLADVSFEAEAAAAARSTPSWVVPFWSVDIRWPKSALERLPQYETASEIDALYAAIWNAEPFDLIDSFDEELFLRLLSTTEARVAHFRRVRKGLTAHRRAFGRQRCLSRLRRSACRQPVHRAWILRVCTLKQEDDDDDMTLADDRCDRSSTNGLRYKRHVEEPRSQKHKSSNQRRWRLARTSVRRYTDRSRRDLREAEQDRKRQKIDGDIRSAVPSLHPIRHGARRHGDAP